jgi:hypothetical protein
MNHLLDCSIYAEAMAEKLGLSKKGPADWDWLERHWRRASEQQRSLFDAPQQPDPAPAAALGSTVIVTRPANAVRPAPLVIDL